MEHEWEQSFVSEYVIPVALAAPEVQVVPGFLSVEEHLHPYLGECQMLHCHPPELVEQSEALVEPAVPDLA